MPVRESAFVFGCENEELVGIIAAPAQAVARVGVLVVVGGPQYRAGSHRQFVQLARRLAADGVPCMRFDLRGMGDSTGEAPGFEDLGADIRAAVDTFIDRQPGLREVVLWGLCDGASAACLYLTQDTRVRGAVLVNPWVRTAATQERAELGHYYGRRMKDPAFWRKLFEGDVSVGPAFAAFSGKAIRALLNGVRGNRPTERGEGFRDRMARALAMFPGPVLITLSGVDLVAAEFRDFVRSEPRLKAWRQAQTTRWLELPAADHTFSADAERRTAEDATLDWLSMLTEADHENIGAV